MKIHIVQKGDTLWKIAKKYGVNFEELKKMNTQLSNPDMIMPGMKIKVPTTGGTIKKEAPLGGMPGTKINMGSKKEMPIVQQPMVKEQPKPLPKVEMPIKEAPKKEMPIKEAPKKEMPIKEVPKAPFVPKVPKAIIPEIDINNYFMMNMANMSVQQPPIQQPLPPQPQPQIQPQLPPKPDNLFPKVKEEVKDVHESFEEPKQETPFLGGIQQPMYPYPCYTYPISPVLPGSGLPCPPGYPYMPYPQVQGAMMPTQPMSNMPANMPYQTMPAVDMDESSSFMPNMPYQMPTQTAPAADNMPGYPAYPQTAPMMQMPYAQPPYYGPTYPISPVLPGTGLPPGQMPYGFPQTGGFPTAGYPHAGGFPQAGGFPHAGGFTQAEGPPQVLGAMDLGVHEMMDNNMPYPMPMQQMPMQQMPMQEMAPPPVAGTKDCGCGGPMAPMGSGSPAPYPQGYQFPQGPPAPGPGFPAGYGPGAPYAPPYGPQGLAQPPLMNPYGPGPMGGAFSMPRYTDESSEYEG